jgi:hypothetical protein
MSLADCIQYATDRLASEYGYNVEAGNGFWYMWKDGQKGKASNSDGFTYMRQGVVVKLDDTTVVVRAVVDNGLNAGEARLTGFAAVSVELIAGAIETALESI